MSETVEGILSLDDFDSSVLIITSEEVQDNSIYKIKIKGLINAKTGETLPPQLIEIKTAYSPLYCSLESLKMLVDTFSLTDEQMLSYIRDASKYADFVSGGKADETDFAVEQFTRTKAILDCLTKSFMTRTYEGGARYKLDTVEFQDATNSTGFRALIDALKKELQKWQDAIRGYYNEGRVKPKATRVGIKSSQNSDVAYTTVDDILEDITRTVPQWK